MCMFIYICICICASQYKHAAVLLRPTWLAAMSHITYRRAENLRRVDAGVDTPCRLLCWTQTRGHEFCSDQCLHRYKTWFVLVQNAQAQQRGEWLYPIPLPMQVALGIAENENAELIFFWLDTCGRWSDENQSGDCRWMFAVSCGHQQVCHRTGIARKSCRCTMLTSQSCWIGTWTTRVDAVEHTLIMGTNSGWCQCRVASTHWVVWFVMQHERAMYHCFRDWVMRRRCPCAQASIWAT